MSTLDKLEKLNQEYGIKTCCEKCGQTMPCAEPIWEANPEKEKQIIHWLLDVKTEFIQRILPHLEDTYFHDESCTKIKNIITEYYKEYGTCPPKLVLIEELSKCSSDDIAGLEAINIIENGKPDYNLYTWIKKHVVQALKRRAYQKALVTISDQFFTDDYEGAFNTLLTAWSDPDTTRTYWLNKSIGLLDESNVDPIGIGYTSIDKYMHMAGAGRGEVLIFMANTGVGKTTTMINVGVNKALANRKVFYCALEGRAEEIARRALSVVSEAPTNNLAAHRDLITERASRVKEMAIRDGGGKFMTIADIKREIIEINKEKPQWEPDIIIVDYAKFMRPIDHSKGEPDYIKLAKVMEDLKRLSVEFKCLIITAQQANREGEDSEYLQLKHAAGSYDALQPVDYVIALDEIIERAGERQFLSFTIKKNRHGPEEKFVKLPVNRTSGKIYNI